ncbi:GTP-binding protein [Streptomyces sp. P1-3]|uniref:GTP-binding protein n=1 Tax=Streptomyces sp. P1-3 TaxID=3421658 RepID=UPI003D36300A
MHTLNLGILAHVDAGKTSLTERLLYAAGVIGEIGSVDDGSTQTDSLALERRRGITIKSAVVSFAIEDATVNLIDTPGHPDFIAEVERVLSVLDGAVLVVSAVEGVQPQTRVLMRTLRRLRIPTLVFVNKIDRGGARHDRLLRSMSEKLTPAIVPMGSVTGLGTRAAAVEPYAAADAGFASALVEQLAEHDESLLAAYVDDEATVSYDRLRAELAAQTGRALVHPVFFGSAITGAGVAALTAGIRELLPAAGGDADGPVSGTVFKVERGPAGEKIAYVRLRSGTVRTRDVLRFGWDGGDGESGEDGSSGGVSGAGGVDGAGSGDREGKVTAVGVFDGGAAVRRTSVSAGQIGKLWGLGGIRVGDTLGDTVGEAATRAGAVGAPATERRHFAPPTLETVVVPRRLSDGGALHAALAQLAEQDPLINLRHDDVRREVSVSLYGEVQKEVIQATLAEDFGVDVTFRETTTICRERPVGTGAAVEFMGAEDNPFRATVGLRVEPAAAGSGVRFRWEIELGALPFSFLKAVEETVHQTLRQGIHGWPVTDCTVTMTHSAYTPPPPSGWSTWSSTAGDFRKLTPLVLMSALRQAGTRVYEPMHRFHLEAPADAFGALLPVLARLGAVPRAPAVRAASCVLEGEIPAASVHRLEQRLPGLTRGEGVLECAFERYQPVRGAIPTRERTDHDPLDRKGYLLRVVRRVAGRGEGE